MSGSSHGSAGLPLLLCQAIDQAPLVTATGARYIAAAGFDPRGHLLREKSGEWFATYHTARALVATALPPLVASQREE